MEVVDQKGYKYNYANYDFGLETIKIIKPSGTRLVFGKMEQEVIGKEKETELEQHNKVMKKSYT